MLVRSLARACLPRRRESALHLLLAVILIALVPIPKVDKNWPLVAFMGVTLYPSILSGGSGPLSAKFGGLETPRTLAPADLLPHTKPDYSVARDGLGEMGRGVYAQSDEDKKIVEEDMKKWFMNVWASDKISMDRSLPDVRSEACKAIEYDHDTLPRTSVVIIFTNEAWSPLLRTVHSVYNRSPERLLHEIVLLDDASDREELGAPLEQYIERFGGKVKLFREAERQGLIRARLAGAKHATGDVLVFLDSHCEANTGWLEPLVQRIKESRSAVLVPTIDGIIDRSMQYHGGAVHSVGGFWWSLHFKWDPIPKREYDRRKSQTEPIRSPTMPGGLFAVERKYFWDIGGYDPGMDIWGGENLEISFRTWMCGGTLEMVPCSHVGHIFRAGHPYNMTTKDVHGTNSARLAEVWMDDYKRLYYMHRRELAHADIGDISERKALRQKLNCKPFKWFLDNIIPEKFVPDENVTAFGMVKNPTSMLCLDTLQRDEKGAIEMGVFSCQSGASSSQVFSLTKDGLLKREESCGAVNRVGAKNVWGDHLRMSTCAFHKVGNDYHWKHSRESGQLVHETTSLCLDSEGLKNGDDVLMKPCVDGKVSQKWEFETYL